VGLAQARVAVDEERVIGLGRSLGDSHRRSVCETVGTANDEVIEVVLGVESRISPANTGRDPLRLWCGGGQLLDVGLFNVRATRLGKSVVRDLGVNHDCKVAH